MPKGVKVQKRDTSNDEPQQAKEVLESSEDEPTSPATVTFSNEVVEVPPVEKEQDAECLQEPAAPTCPDGKHAMVFGEGDYISYCCNKCSKEGLGPRWHCVDDQADLCHSCAPPPQQNAVEAGTNAAVCDATVGESHELITAKDEMVHPAPKCLEAAETSSAPPVDAGAEDQPDCTPEALKPEEVEPPSPAMITSVAQEESELLTSKDESADAEEARDASPPTTATEAQHCQEAPGVSIVQGEAMDVEESPKSVQAPKFRTAKDEAMPAEDALKELKDGNLRFQEGTSIQAHGATSSEDWNDMVEAGQSPFVAVLGCADSRCPVEILFDAKPGDIFVCRNAGNTCTHAEGSVLGSLEFCVGALRSRLILVLGHTYCGAMRGATAAWSAKSRDGPKTALDALLKGLINVADAAARDLGPGAREEDVANHAVKINVIQTMEFLLKHSQPIREAVRAGLVQVQGAVYHIETGEVQFIGPSPRQQILLRSEVQALPSAVATVEKEPWWAAWSPTLARCARSPFWRRSLETDLVGR